MNIHLIGSRIQEARNIKQYTLDDIANEIGVARSTIQRYEKGKIRNPKLPVLQAIASCLDVDPAWLSGKNVSMISKDDEVYTKDNKKGVKIPVLGKVAAGIPIEAVEDIIDWEEITEDLAKTGTFFALQIKGDSMSPKILDGDVVIVKQQSSANSGEIVISIVNGFDACCKKLIKHDTGVTLLSFNENYEPMFFTQREIIDKPVAIIGKVVELRRKFL